MQREEDHYIRNVIEECLYRDKKPGVAWRTEQDWRSLDDKVEHVKDYGNDPEKDTVALQKGFCEPSLFVLPVAMATVTYIRFI
ncbi:hypothetical protein L596_020409 [Steinernema carpocapsae]|uniref:Uncharacterized protein n=1 Tax=Steinernema carpocapsae TaxID=34508 RepID=A0A4U5MU85_STECR|nr:hypothetical protein L596_020409 [Steinernema carpocapsae]